MSIATAIEETPNEKQGTGTTDVMPKTIPLIMMMLAFNLTPAFAGSDAGAKELEALPDGYVSIEALPDSLALIPSVPKYGSARQNLDNATAAAAITLQGTARFDLARRDADLSFPDAPNVFACALGARISEDETPVLVELLERAMVDSGLSTYPAKIEFQRPRPFMVNGAPICTPDEEEALRGDGSYPSGHTAVGWAWALILAELVPERAEAILARGIAYGESRSVCNVHWRSDVVAGRTYGAAAVAQMHSNPEFTADMKAAKAEIIAASTPNVVACNTEATTLAIKP